MTSSSTPLKKKPEAKEPPSSSERVTNYDANFDRDNPSLLPYVLVTSSELKSLSYNLLSSLNSNVHVSSIKSPPWSIKSPLSSLEHVTNPDANFDRDNPSMSTSSFDILLSDRTPKAIIPKVGTSTQSNNIPSVSYNLLLDRTPNAIKSLRLPSNDTKLLQLSSNNQNNNKVQLATALNTPPLSNSNSHNNNNNNNNNTSTSSLHVLLSDRTLKAIKLKNSNKAQPATASKAPPLSNNNYNNNINNNNNTNMLNHSDNNNK
jgi:hypothetical protein